MLVLKTFAVQDLRGGFKTFGVQNSSLSWKWNRIKCGLYVPCTPPPTYHWLGTCGQQPSTLQPPWSDTLPLRTWSQSPTPTRNTHKTPHISATNKASQSNTDYFFNRQKEWDVNECSSIVNNKSIKVELGCSNDAINCILTAEEIWNIQQGNCW